MRIELDRERCISAGRCMATAPGVFDQDDDGIVVLVRSEADPDEEELVREAQFLCPASVIALA